MNLIRTDPKGARVNALRRHCLRHRHLAAWLVVLALAARLLVPAGFMPVAANGGVTMMLCTGMGPVTATPHAMPGMRHGAPAKQDGHGKAEAPCAFSSVTAPTLGGADPLLLAAAILFVMAVAIRRRTPLRMALREHLRPPLRGPPALG